MEPQSPTDFLSRAQDQEPRNSNFLRLASPNMRTFVDQEQENDFRNDIVPVTKVIQKAPINKKPYQNISNELRLKLIDAIENKGQKINQAAKHLGINYSSAKSIYQIYRREGRLDKMNLKRKIVNQEPKHSIQYKQLFSEPFHDQLGLCLPGALRNDTKASLVSEAIDSDKQIPLSKSQDKIPGPGNRDQEYLQNSTNAKHMFESHVPNVDNTIFNFPSQLINPEIPPNLQSYEKINQNLGYHEYSKPDPKIYQQRDANYNLTPVSNQFFSKLPGFLLFPNENATNLPQHFPIVPESVISSANTLQDKDIRYPQPTAINLNNETCDRNKLFHPDFITSVPTLSIDQKTSKTQSNPIKQQDIINNQMSGMQFTNPGIYLAPNNIGVPIMFIPQLGNGQFYRNYAALLPLQAVVQPFGTYTWSNIQPSFSSGFPNFISKPTNSENS